jgi:hypothetical protein
LDVTFSSREIPLLPISFFVIFAGSWLNGIALLRRLRLAHPGVWENLGRPSIMDSNFAQSHWAIVRFVWSLHFAKEADPILTRHCVAVM